ncbi:serine/threonine-protein kinase Nek8-like isoform X1 [Acropora palmata]|uniref:serine/threonine-protein kinase Nek8-like isoform X1 n=1 Tax=Acropora palmata TaxID=6131 RepID=UPI003D9FC6A1
MLTNQWNLQYFLCQEVLAIQGEQFTQDVHYSWEIVGEGRFGVCKKVIVTTNRDPVTVCIKTARYSQGVNEIPVLQRAKERNITQIVGLHVGKLIGRKAVICMEYMSGGTLKEYVKEGRRLSEETCAAFGKDLFLAVKFLHEEVGVIHGDIHASNVLLDEHRTYVKLADLGSAQAIQEDRPRCFDDIWQIGCVLLFMLNGATSLLFYENDPDEEKRMEAVNPEEHFPPSRSASREMLKLLNLILGVGRKQLPSAAEILRDATIFNQK